MDEQKYKFFLHRQRFKDLMKNWSPYSEVFLMEQASASDWDGMLELLYGEDGQAVYDAYEKWCSDFSGSVKEIGLLNPNLIYGKEHGSMTDEDKEHRVAMIAGTWVKLCDDGEIRNKNKASLFRVISEKFKNEYNQNLPEDELYEKDIVLEPLKALLLRMPRHKAPYQRWKKQKDGSMQLLPRIPG